MRTWVHQLSETDNMQTPKPSPGSYRVLLANRGNPDYGQDPDKPLPGSPADSYAPATSWAEASALCRRYINEHALGGGNWAGGRVEDGQGAYVARVAYNGRVFAPESAGGRLLSEASE